MKALALTWAMATLVAATAAATAQAVVTAACDFGELTVDLGAVVEPAFKCQTASGFSFVPPSTLPTAAQIKTICAKCTDLLSAVQKMAASLPTCSLPMDDGSTVAVDKLFLGIVAQCTGGSNPTAPSPNSDSGSSSSSRADAPSAGLIPTSPPAEKIPAAAATTRAPISSARQPAEKTAPDIIAVSAGGSDGSDDSDGADDSESSNEPEESRETSASGSELSTADAASLTTQAPQPSAFKPTAAATEASSASSTHAATTVMAASLAGALVLRTLLL